MKPVRIGIVGLGNNTRKRHVPGFRSIEGVEIVSVCNRRPESTQAAAREFGIPKTFDDWRQLVADDDIDAVMIGTWPYLHCPITLAAIQCGKHILTEARMAASLEEAQHMLVAAQNRPELITQIVPSPFGLRGGAQVLHMLESHFIGELREYCVNGIGADFADPTLPLHWRQSSELSGINMLALGILHETLMRWIPDPEWVFASTKTISAQATRPEIAHLLTRLSTGAMGVYHLSGVAHHAADFSITLWGSQGTIKYDLISDRLMAAQVHDAGLTEVVVPPERLGGWRVEEDFIRAIRGGPRPSVTDFATGLRYMRFTDAVERSANQALPVTLDAKTDSTG